MRLAHFPVAKCKASFLSIKKKMKINNTEKSCGGREIPTVNSGTQRSSQSNFKPSLYYKHLGTRERRRGINQTFTISCSIHIASRLTLYEHYRKEFTNRNYNV